MNKTVRTSILFMTLAPASFMATAHVQFQRHMNFAPAQRHYVGQSTPNTGATPPRQGGQAKVDLSGADRRFVEDAAGSDAAEIAHARLALQRASSDDVKQFAQRMIDDHMKADQELARLAAGKGVSLEPGRLEQPQPAGKERAVNERLSKLSGADFDREYMRGQVKMHDEAVSLFEREARKGKDAELKDFASRTLPTLREHQTAAREVAAKVGAGEKPVSKASKSSTPTPGAGTSPSRGPQRQ
jgi:putative membrane protein